MNEIGRVIKKSIYQGSWIKISYSNQKDETTYFIVSVKRIYSETKKLVVSSYNVEYKNNVDERQLFFDKIISAELLDGTIYDVPSSLLDELNNYPEKYSFLNGDYNKNDIVDYYNDCFKLDCVPYDSKYALIPGIDDEVVSDKESVQLSDQQFYNYLDKIYKKQQKKFNVHKTIDLSYAMNILSIKTNKGLYVLCYKELKLDIKTKSLKCGNEIIVNKSFSYNSKTNKAENIDNYMRYLPEEDFGLFDDVSNNLEKIKASICDYNKNRFSSYNKEVKLDTLPYVICLAKNYGIDITRELSGIKDMISNKTEMSLPILTFFGENVKLQRRQTYPIFVIDDKYNIDQINAIDKGMKSPVSYIQGPPGTGKTKTLINAIVTALINNKTVLVSSNNNIPMDGVYNDIKKLKYKNTIPLLFPAIRLGNSEVINEAIETINAMYKVASDLNVYDDYIDRIKKDRKESSKALTELLDKHDKYTNLVNRKESCMSLLNSANDQFVKVALKAELANVESKITELGNVELDSFKSCMDVETNDLFMAIHFETAGNLQKLDKTKFSELKTILTMDANSEEEKAKRTKQFKNYLSANEGLSIFQEIFPIIITTNMSACYLGEPNVQFDILMMDEAGQCNIANALIPIVRAKQLILVGDPQQLSPVIVLDKSLNAKLKNKYNIPDEYDYIMNSIYTTFTQVDIINNETLLSYHYRCNNKIMKFPNDKFYNKKLKLCSDSTEENPLVFIDTSKLQRNNNDNIKNVSIAEANEICKYIKEHESDQIGIITPFFNQKECIESFLNDYHLDNVTIGTVHEFQGDQKKTIIFSSAVTKNTKQSTYQWLKNNSELINFAVSRAIDKFIMLGSFNSICNLSSGTDNFKELAEYVISNGSKEVTSAAIISNALGTKQISTQSEKEFNQTINHALSIINNNCYTKSEVALSSIFVKESTDDLNYFMQKIDLVVFEKKYGGDIPILGFELNGPEHLTNSDTIARDKAKKNYCDKHNFTLLAIPRDCARDYQMIKSIIMDLFVK